MFELTLANRQCASCGICEDVCAPGAIAMEPWRGLGVEGTRGTGTMGTFPYLANAEKCDGCGECVTQCPAEAMAIVAT